MLRLFHVIEPSFCERDIQPLSSHLTRVEVRFEQGREAHDEDDDAQKAVESIASESKPHAEPSMGSDASYCCQIGGSPYHTAPLTIACDGRGFITRITYLLDPHCVVEAPRKVAALFARSGRLGRAVVDLRAWPTLQADGTSVLAFRQAVTPYLTDGALLVCLRAPPQAPAQWLHVAPGFHMSFDAHDALCGMRFPGLASAEVACIKRATPQSMLGQSLYLVAAVLVAALGWVAYLWRPIGRLFKKRRS